MVDAEQNATWCQLLVPWLMAVLVTAGAAAFIFYRQVRSLKGRGTIDRNYPRDVVVLRQVGRGPHAPSLSPFPLKLETYLRMAKIPYVCDYKSAWGPNKGKTPWISYNDEDVEDTQFCINYLNKKFNIDFNRHLSDKEKAVARTFRIMVEDHLYWALALSRYVYSRECFDFMRKHRHLPGYMMNFVARRIQKMAYAQGIGRHTQREVYYLAEGDFENLSTYLDDKPFLTGPEPCEEDCSLFGMLSQTLYHLPGTPYPTLLLETYPNLVAYCDRMKTRFWPDWDDCITHGGTKEPKA